MKLPPSVGNLIQEKKEVREEEIGGFGCDITRKKAATGRVATLALSAKPGPAMWRCYLRFVNCQTKREPKTSTTADAPHCFLRSLEFGYSSRPEMKKKAASTADAHIAIHCLLFGYHICLMGTKLWSPPFSGWPATHEDSRRWLRGL